MILLVRHADSVENESITVTRGRIPIDSTTFRMLESGVAHLWVYGFSDTTEQEVRTALEQFRDAEGRGLVLDLRNNPGGLLAAVIDVADLFLDGGPILYEIDAQGNRTDHEAGPGGDARSIPIVVLVNQYSASASEILAGAIKVNKPSIRCRRNDFWQRQCQHHSRTVPMVPRYTLLSDAGTCLTALKLRGMV